MSDLRKERARLVGESGSLAANIAELNEKTIELELELVGLPVDRRSLAVEELTKLQPLKIKLTETRAELLEQLDQLEVRTPVTGIVHDSQVHGRRSVVVEATPIMYVVPTDRPAIAVVRVDARDIDQVHAGQQASLRFNAFHRRAMPIITGEVLTVSPDAYVDQLARSYYYEARDRHSRRRPAEGTRAATCWCRACRWKPSSPPRSRRPFSYVTKPLVDYFNRAFRDT